MPISLCSAQIALRGDDRLIVHRDRFDPLTWPEIAILEFTHGPESVSEVEVVGTRETTVAAELARLRRKYGSRPVQMVYPGANPGMAMEAPPHIPRAGADTAPKRGRKSKPTPPDPFDIAAPADGELIED